MTGGLFLGNYANYGGGVATQGSVSCSFSNIRILGNESNSSSSSSGGFAYFITGSTGSTFVNCVISGNKSLGRNGVYRPTGATRFVNCSIVGNQSGDLGGIVILFAGDSIAMDNSIMWGNTATGGNSVYVNSQTASANYSLFNPAQSIGTISGSNNQNSDPLFTDANGADNVYGTEDDDFVFAIIQPCIGQRVFFRSQLFHDRSSWALSFRQSRSWRLRIHTRRTSLILRHPLLPYKRIKRT